MKVYEATEFLTSEDSSDYLGKGSFATARRCYHVKLDDVVIKCFDLSEIGNQTSEKQNK